MLLATGLYTNDILIKKYATLAGFPDEAFLLLQAYARVF
jgi:hypothetical protein